LWGLDSLGGTIVRAAMRTPAPLSLACRRIGAIVFGACRRQTGISRLVRLDRNSGITSASATFTLCAPGGFALPAVFCH
jgi:hypothetical protein